MVAQTQDGSAQGGRARWRVLAQASLALLVGPHVFAGLLAVALLGACGGAGGDAAWKLEEPPPFVPVETVQLGEYRFRAYGWPEDTFRIVCQEPCAVDEAYLKARHQGFAAVKGELVVLAGMDVLPQFTPVHIHVAADSVCRYSEGTAGGALYGSGPVGAHVCLWDVEKSRPSPGYVPLSLTVKAARSRAAQMLPIHEYAHVLFFDRHAQSYEWVVRAFSYRLTGYITDLCDERLVGAGAQTAFELCQRSGMRWEDLTAALSAMARLYDEGRGAEDNGATSVYQLHTLLNARLGSNTYAACVASGELRPSQCGDSATLAPEGGTVSMYDGSVLWSLPEGSLAAPLELSPGSGVMPMRFGGAWPNFMSAHAFEFLPVASFAGPVQLTLRYDPALLPEGADASTLAIWEASTPSGQLLEGSQVDVTKHEVTASVPRTGRYLVAPRDPTEFPPLPEHPH